MNKQVAIVDARSLVRNSKSTLERHKLYGDKLKEVSNGKYSLCIIDFGKNHSEAIESKGKLQFIGLSRNPIKAYSNLRKLKATNCLQVEAFVAGDPWESFLIARTIRRMLFPKARIQVQVHGDIGNPSWIYASITNFVRSLLTALTLRKANQLRVTTQNQGANLIARFGVDKNFFRVIPVPANLLDLDRLPNALATRPHSLGFVARMQKDRGLDVFITLSRQLKIVDPDFSVVIAGGGAESRMFENRLREILPPEKIRFLGEVESSNMSSVWSQIGVLASTAPTESYGRAIREALAHGVPVWASPSSGANDLVALVTDGSVRLLTEFSSVEDLYTEFLELLQTDVNPDFRQQLIDSDQKSLQLLAESWAELCS